MADSTSGGAENILILYDGTGRILHLTGAHPPFTVESLLGEPAWHSMSTEDATICQAAILRCIDSGEPQTFDVTVNDAGRWRATIHRCRVGKVRLIGYVRRFPDSVLAITPAQRQICKLLAAGLSSIEIAKQLDRARETVDNHRAAIAKRIGIKPWSLIAWCGEHREWF
jgi:DNA-binding CsgD family transcriptional regulator